VKRLGESRTKHIHRGERHLQQCILRSSFYSRSHASSVLRRHAETEAACIEAREFFGNVRVVPQIPMHNLGVASRLPCGRGSAQPPHWSQAGTPATRLARSSRSRQTTGPSSSPARQQVLTWRFAWAARGGHDSALLNGALQGKRNTPALRKVKGWTI
jgi:hypothetical protein